MFAEILSNSSIICITFSKMYSNILPWVLACRKQEDPKMFGEILSNHQFNVSLSQTCTATFCRGF
jgi:hypothetical protein